MLPLQLAACSDRVLQRRVEEAPDDTVLIIDVDAGSSGTGRQVSSDPHAVLGVAPTHGPFVGGQLVTIRGNGFSSGARVWFGAVELDEPDVTALDPNRIQVRVPAGEPGAADVSVQIGDDSSTRRTLVDGYRYDAFYVDPANGSTSGGTIVTLVGMGTDWDEQTEVLVDLEPCEVLEVRDGAAGTQELDCRTPPGSPGSKVVAVRTGERTESVTGAYSYAESATNFEGGIGGEALEDRLEVTVLDELFGEPLAGVDVFLGDGRREDRATVTDSSGVASFAGELGPVQSLTVAGRCVQPLTLVDVPADTLTLYAAPILSPECLPPSLDIPRFGGSAGAAPVQFLKGSLSWGTGIELRQASWRNVPLPENDSEEQVAYVFELAQDSSASFRLPSRFHMVTPQEKGTIGYEFELETRNTGNMTLYALAGIERNGSNGREFTPYAMGMVQGVDGSDPEQHPVIPMDVTLDHALSVEVSSPPTQVEGPDRVRLEVLLRVGRAGFIPLPHTARTVLLPVGEVMEFQGLPALAGALNGAEYVITAKASTGATETLPVADVEALATRTTDQVIFVDRFIEVPRLTSPLEGEAWGLDLLAFDSNISGDFDLWVVSIEALGGLLQWRVIAPRERSHVDLPDLMAYGVERPTGPVRVVVAAARIRDFDYGNLRQRSFGPAGWAAYSADEMTVRVP